MSTLPPLEETPPDQARTLVGWRGLLLTAFAALYTAAHLYVLNVAPVETWTFRILHVAGGMLIGFVLMAAHARLPEQAAPLSFGRRLWAAAGVLSCAVAAGALAFAVWSIAVQGALVPPSGTWDVFAFALITALMLALAGSWSLAWPKDRVGWCDAVLAVIGIMVAAYLLLHLEGVRLRFGAIPVFPDMWVALAGLVLILELTRRVAGMALVVIALVFLGYSFAAPFLPGFLADRGFETATIFTYLYTDNGVLGPTTAVSSTYIILFITFAAFLNASKVSDYFVNLAFAAAGRAKGGPAKVAVLASGLMGMINGTSAGNVVSTGALTIPLMKRVGYPAKSAGAVEAAASTGGQIMPPIMGAGAFIMAELTGIPYGDLITAAIIPAVLYFVSILLNVDFEARRLGMRGMTKEELPDLRAMLRQIHLFLPILILVGALFLGYSVIRAGTLALVAAAVVSWLSPHRMGPRQVVEGLDNAARMAVQLIAVCACAGIIVGVIGLTGVGLRFSTVLLAFAEQSQLLAMIFAMLIAMILGMGMPTTAAYAVAASVVAPGLVQMGVSPLVAHMFIFYYAVVSAITPPVALAAYAAAGLSGASAMGTAVASFKVGLAAFIVPFVFFYDSALLLEGTAFEIARVSVTGLLGIVLLAGSIQGWLGSSLKPWQQAVLAAAALALIVPSWQTELFGGGTALIFLFMQVRQHRIKQA